MIQYRFRIGKDTRRLWLENDEEAEDFAKFINAEEWYRDVIIIILRDGDMMCQFEINDEDFKLTHVS